MRNGSWLGFSAYFLWVEKCECWIQVLLLLWDLPFVFLVFDLHTCHEPLHVVLRRLVHLSHDEEVLLAQRGGVEAQVCREVRLQRRCTRGTPWRVAVSACGSILQGYISLTLTYNITVHDSLIVHVSIAKFKFACISRHFKMLSNFAKLLHFPQKNC